MARPQPTPKSASIIIIIVAVFLAAVSALAVWLAG